MSLTVIYIHGFNSSPQSSKAQQVQRYFEDNELYEKHYKLEVPELHYAPKMAMKQLCALVESAIHERVLLIGSSLGGYYSLWLAHKYQHCKAVLVNPAVYPYRLLENLLGPNENIYSQEKYCLTTEHIQQLKDIDVVDFNVNFKNKERLLLLTQTGDETLDYKEAVDRLVGIEQRVMQGGDHGFENFTDVISNIFDFALTAK